MPSDIPPKQTFEGSHGNDKVPTDLFTRSPQAEADHRADDDHDSGALVSIHAAALKSNADSFPVLKAFQDYLESERQRARKRMTMMTVFFLITLLVVVGGLLTGGFFVYSRAVRHNEAMQSTLLELALRQPPMPTPGSPRIEPDELADRVTSRLRAALDEKNLRPLAAARGKTKESPEINELSAGLAAIREENRRLREQFGALNKSLPRLTSDLAEVVRQFNANKPIPVAQTETQPTSATDQPAALSAEPSSPGNAVAVAAKTPPAPVTRAPSPKIPPGHREMTVRLHPRGQSDTIPWRLIIPE